MRYLLLFVLSTSLAFGVVSIEPVEVQEEANRSFEQGLSFGTKSGNVEELNLKLASSLKEYHKGYVNTLFLTYEYKEVNSVKNTNALLVHLRHIHALRPKKLDVELFTQLEKDDFRKITSKTLLGSNIRYKFRNKKLDAFVGVGLFQAWLNEADQHTSFSALNSYVALSYPFSQTTSLTYKLYFQPRLKQMDDYNIYQKAQLQLKMTNQLTLLVEILHTFDSKPSASIKQSDIVQTTGLSYRF